MASCKLPAYLLLRFLLGHIAGAYVAPLQSVLSSL